MCSKFPSFSSAKIVQILKQHGFEEKRQRGSHLILLEPKRKLRATVPVGKKDVPIGTARSILKEAKIDLDQLR